MIITALASPTSSSDRLDAVLARDRAFDAAFVYGVTSTRIYCRPSCPSRRPRADRIRFFDTTAEAARAGFRPCRRCRPDAAADPQSAQIAGLCAFIRANCDRRLTLDALSRRAGISPHHLHRMFVRHVGVSPREYMAACRMRRLRRDLRSGQPVTRAMHDAGYGSSSRLYERVQGAMGMTPATYGKGGAGAAIRYAIDDSPFGRLLVATTDRGVAAVKIAGTDAVLEQALRTEFHAASITREDAALRPAVRAVLKGIDGAAARVPVDVAATAFQWRVWRALQAIPRGSTRTYGEIAQAIGRPSAVRAVARACASNPVALVIPCHRVVPSAGGPGGYRWGADVKAALLERERATIPAQAGSGRADSTDAAGQDAPAGRAARAGRASRAG
jgi:AraC family transcriptional regulator, regulatory protein of adaptative response / methylated-DNA-[protein]-cysteine methyltransferase